MLIWLPQTWILYSTCTYILEFYCPTILSRLFFTRLECIHLSMLSLNTITIPYLWCRAQSEQGIAHARIHSSVELNREPLPTLSEPAKDLVRWILNEKSKYAFTGTSTWQEPHYHVLYSYVMAREKWNLLFLFEASYGFFLFLMSLHYAIDVHLVLNIWIMQCWLAFELLQKISSILEHKSNLTTPHIRPPLCALHAWIRLWWGCFRRGCGQLDGGSGADPARMTAGAAVTGDCGREARRRWIRLPLRPHAHGGDLRGGELGLRWTWRSSSGHLYDAPQSMSLASANKIFTCHVRHHNS